MEKVVGYGMMAVITNNDELCHRCNWGICMQDCKDS